MKNLKSYKYIINYRELNVLVDNVITRKENNSCILIGPRASGKSTVFYIYIYTLANKFSTGEN